MYTDKIRMSLLRRRGHGVARNGFANAVIPTAFRDDGRGTIGAGAY
jgi:hypothetical protein